MEKNLEMNELEIRKLIKSVIRKELESEGFKVKSIILFGSRARGDYDDYSDWDIFVVVDKKLDFPRKRKIASKIRRKLAMFDIAIDIIIKSERDVEIQKNNVGYITYYALREGVKL